MCVRVCVCACACARARVCVWCNNVCVVDGGSVHACIVCGVSICVCAHMRMCGVVYSAACVHVVCL